MKTNKVNKRDLGTLAAIKKKGSKAHVFGGKVYIGNINACRLSLFENMIRKGLVESMPDKSNWYKISEYGFKELQKLG